MLEQDDLLKRAEDCERALHAAHDPREKNSFKILRDMWIALAKESSSLSSMDLAKQVVEVLYAGYVSLEEGRKVVLS